MLQKLFLFPVLFVSVLFAQEASTWQKYSEIARNVSRKETFYVDNMVLQTYRGKMGIWKTFPAGTTLHSIAQNNRSIVSEIQSVNGFSANQERMAQGGWIFVPYKKSYIQELEIAGIRRESITQPKGNFLWPIQGSAITSRLGKRWGRHHDGIDIAAPIGTIVVAAQDGVVQMSEYYGAYGNLVVIKHDIMYSTYYGHLSAPLVKKGDVIRKGQIIALSGNTGRSTGPHLHFEVRAHNVVLDPEQFLPGFEQSVQASADLQMELKAILSDGNL